VITEHDRVEEIEIAFARLVDHAAGETAVERKNHSVADGYRGLRLLKNDRQSPCGVCELAGEMHGEGPHDLHSVLLLPTLCTIKGALGCLPKRIESAMASQNDHCSRLRVSSFKDQISQIA
jgi:hypothetical protein